MTTQESDWLANLRAPDKLSSQEYEYPADRRALKAFQLIPGGQWLTKTFLNFWLKFDVAALLGSAVKVSERQFPEVNATVVRVGDILGITPPPVYLEESPELKAYTFGPDQHDVYVVVTRGLLEAATTRELTFVLGHEMGHIKSQHVLYHSLAQWLTHAGLFAVSSVPVPIARELFGMLSTPAKLALLAWQRRAEITADRCGLIACQDLSATQRALALLSMGSRQLADRIDIAEFESQGTENFGRWGEIFASHPYLPKRLRAIRLFARGEFYLRRILQDHENPFVAGEDLEESIAGVLADKRAADPIPTKQWIDEVRLKVIMAYAAAWEDGELSTAESKALRSLLKDLSPGTPAPADFDPLLNGEVSWAALERDVRYFKGNKAAGLAYAISVLCLEGAQLTRSKKRFLANLLKMAGVPDEEASKVVDSIKARKELLVRTSQAHLCSSCATVYPSSEQKCPRCGVLASALAKLDQEAGTRMCRSCDVVLALSEIGSCPVCGSSALHLVTTAKPVS